MKHGTHEPRNVFFFEHALAPSTRCEDPKAQKRGKAVWVWRGCERKGCGLKRTELDREKTDHISLQDERQPFPTRDTSMPGTVDVRVGR